MWTAPEPHHVITQLNSFSGHCIKFLHCLHGHDIQGLQCWRVTLPYMHAVTYLTSPPGPTSSLVILRQFHFSAWHFPLLTIQVHLLAIQ
jgi:hypothetical protein